MRVVYRSRRNVYRRLDDFRKYLKKRQAIDGGRWNPLAVEEHVCCAPGVRHEDHEPLPEVILKVPVGTYEIVGSRYPLLRLVFEVVKHRTSHLLQGEGWTD